MTSFMDAINPVTRIGAVLLLATPLLVDMRSREKGVREQAERVAVARGRRLEQAADDAEREALASAPAASPLVPGHHLGVSAQPKNRTRRRRRS